MSTLNSTTVTNWLADTKQDPYLMEARVRNAHGTYTSPASTSIRVSDVVRFVWLPFKAVVIGGLFRTTAGVGAATGMKIGILGKSGTTYDNDDDLLTADVGAMSGALAVTLPSAAASGNTPYVVTDPAGAYIIGTVLDAAFSAAKTISTQIQWARD